MEDRDPQEEDRLLDADLNEKFHSLEIELQVVTMFEDHIGFPWLLSGSKLMETP